MAEEAEEQPQEENVLGKLETKIKLLTYVALAGVGLTLCTISVVIVWVSIISGSITENVPMDADVLEQSLNGIDKRLTSLYERIDTQQDDMNFLTARIKKTENTHINKQIAIIQDVLVNQQQDYGRFLKILDDGMISLAQMVRGNREWTKKYSEKMKRAQHISEQRIREIKDLEVASPKNADD